MPSSESTSQSLEFFWRGGGGGVGGSRGGGGWKWAVADLIFPAGRQSITTARQRSLQEDNVFSYYRPRSEGHVFTYACLSYSPGRGWLSRHAPELGSVYSGRGHDRGMGGGQGTPPPEIVTDVVGAHPPGIHSVHMDGERFIVTTNIMYWTSPNLFSMKHVWLESGRLALYWIASFFDKLHENERALTNMAILIWISVSCFTTWVSPLVSVIVTSIWVFPKCFRWIERIQWQKFSKRTKTCYPATTCVKDQHATTVPGRHMWETGSLNWANFISLPEFAEFIEILLSWVKTPLLIQIPQSLLVQHLLTSWCTGRTVLCITGRAWLNWTRLIQTWLIWTWWIWSSTLFKVSVKFLWNVFLSFHV